MGVVTRRAIATIPLTVAAANRVVSRLHRHHGPIPAGLASFAIGAVVEGRLCGVAIVGRPANRNSDDGFTAEVLRVATDGTDNAPSALYGAAARTACAQGYARVITYTLESESGASLRGVGWRREAEGIQSKWARYDRASGSYGQVKQRPHFEMHKVRWAKVLRQSVPEVLDQSLADVAEATQTMPLFTEVPA